MTESIEFKFDNGKGETLSGRLELPKVNTRGFAVFAHCFTCSKDFIAANRISKKLSALGIGVLRFDFTGLGNSGGDFSNTNFSSNVGDLIAATKALEEKYQSPCMLIGHSLGGAAVLRAALELENVKAVVTINAPSDIKHVQHLFQDDLSEIKSKGEATVSLAGRNFKIKKQFIDDLEKHDFLEKLSHKRKNYLIMHSPIDNLVSIDHAGEIFISLKHPKSFVSLDSADHLLTKKADADYVAHIISAWAEKTLPTKEVQRPEIGGQIETISRIENKFTQDIYSDDHYLVADEPPKVSGDNLGMDPYELLLSSLGACTAMTIKMYAARKNIKLDSLNVILNHEKRHMKDCKDCDQNDAYLDHINKKIHITGPELTDEQKQRLLEIAERCPVNKTLKSKVDIELVD